jgi:hypothetical protein
MSQTFVPGGISLSDGSVLMDHGSVKSWLRQTKEVEGARDGSAVMAEGIGHVEPARIASSDPTLHHEHVNNQHLLIPSPTAWARLRLDPQIDNLPLAVQDHIWHTLTAIQAYPELAIGLVKLRKAGSLIKSCDAIRAGNVSCSNTP